MNEVPPSPGQEDEVDDLYRRASALDPSRPSESVRRAVLDHAARLAAQRPPETGPLKIDFTRPAANQAWRRPAIFGTLAAAALAGLIVAPQFLTPRAPVAPVSPPAPALAQNEDQLRDRMSKRRAESSPAEAKNNLQLRADAEPGASAAEPAAEMAANNAPAKKTPSSADAASAAARQSSRAAQNSGAAQRSATAQNALTAQTSVGAVSSPAAPNLPAAPSPPAAQSLAGARSSAKVQSADKGQGTDNVQSSPGPQDAVTAQDSAAASGALKAEERRTQGVNSSISAFSAPPHAAASMAPAARLADPSAELRRAAEIGDLPALQVLVDKQPETEIDARDPSGRTALMLATLHGQIQAVEMLLAHGADPNAADGRGTSPLQAAIAGDQPTIVAALRRAGAR